MALGPGAHPLYGGFLKKWPWGLVPPFCRGFLQKRPWGLAPIFCEGFLKDWPWGLAPILCGGSPKNGPGAWHPSFVEVLSKEWPWGLAPIFSRGFLKTVALGPGTHPLQAHFLIPVNVVNLSFVSPDPFDIAFPLNGQLVFLLICKMCFLKFVLPCSMMRMNVCLYSMS